MCVQITPRRNHPAQTHLHGDLVAFPSGFSEEHHCIFGLGKILKIRSREDILVHWLGNIDLASAKKPFALGWIDGKDNRSYYAAKPTHVSHAPLTSDDAGTNITLSSITQRAICYGRTDE